MIHRSFFKKTRDDWCGNFKIGGDCYRDGAVVRDLLAADGRHMGENYVHVSLLEMRGGDNTWRVCVWGNDDTGMEKDFPLEGLAEALNLFKSIAIMNDVTMAALRGLGFVRT